ncbi:MAG: hypothetical protein WC544_00205 [Patescibacteria group bacterium]
MFATTHVLAGIAICQRMPSMWPAIGLALLSHYFLDLIPHGDKHLGPWMARGPGNRRMAYVVGADLFGTLILLAILWQTGVLPKITTLLPVLMASVLPDLLLFIGFFISRRPQPETGRIGIFTVLKHVNDFHRYIHNLIDRHCKSIWLGIAVQIIIFFGLLYAVVGWR